jgi:hypothetical protein
MEESLAISWVLIFATKAIWSLVIPVIIAFAASKLWGCVPTWIPVSFVVSALAGVIQSLPIILMQLNVMAAQQYGMIAIPMAVFSGVAHLLFALACLALAFRVSRALPRQAPAQERTDFVMQ